MIVVMMMTGPMTVMLFVGAVLRIEWRFER
jgi:hypothetical protein